MASVVSFDFFSTLLAATGGTHSSEFAVIATLCAVLGLFFLRSFWGVSFRVLRVIDGDTIVVLMHGQEVRVRLLGIDTPESVHPHLSPQPLGKQASVYLQQLLDGRRVYLRGDTRTLKTDAYGRLLAYVYRKRDWKHVNIALLRKGYAQVYRKQGFRKLRIFEAAEAQARRKGRGMWMLNRYLQRRQAMLRWAGRLVVLALLAGALVAGCRWSPEVAGHVQSGIIGGKALLERKSEAVRNFLHDRLSETGSAPLVAKAGRVRQRFP